MYIDDVIGGNQMTLMLDKLVSSSKFKNPDDLLDNLTKCFDGNTAKSKEGLDLINEFETGLKELYEGKDVIISRKIRTDGSGSGYEKLEKGGNEIDVLNITEKKIIECKRVSGANGDAVKERINDIILKFNKEEKISATNRSLYPNHFGQLKIDNPSNPYFNLNKQQFINKVKQDFLPNINNSGIDKTSLKTSIQELEVSNAQGIFKIKNNEW